MANTRDNINNYFLGISDEDLRTHKQIVAKERKRTTGMLKREAKKKRRQL